VNGTQLVNPYVTQDVTRLNYKPPALADWQRYVILKTGGAAEVTQSLCLFNYQSHPISHFVHVILAPSFVENELSSSGYSQVHYARFHMWQCNWEGTRSTRRARFDNRKYERKSENMNAWVTPATHSNKNYEREDVCWRLNALQSRIVFSSKLLVRYLSNT
jgi:hypothetical protein